MFLVYFGPLFSFDNYFPPHRLLHLEEFLQEFGVVFALLKFLFHNHHSEMMILISITCYNFIPNFNFNSLSTNLTKKNNIGT